MMVGVLDSGFDRVDTNPAFDRARNAGLIQIGGNFPNGGAISPLIYEEHYHGAMVLSTMAGHLDTPGGQHYMGTAPDATYVLFRTEDVGWEHLVEEYHWVAAAERADSIGCDVLNTSLGYSLFDETSDSHSLAELDGNTFPITRASDIAASKGMLVFNSAGNSGNSPWQKVTAPADGDEVIAVGAVTPSGQHAGFSSYGPTADGRIKPDLCAAGQDAVYVHPDGSIRTGNGTSFASPILCGAATSLWSAHPPRFSVRRPQRLARIRSPMERSRHRVWIWHSRSLEGPPLARREGASERRRICSYTPIPLVPRPGFFMWFSRKRTCVQPQEHPVTWSILDGLGRTVLEGHIEREKEALTTLSISVEHLAAGTYILALLGVPEEDPTNMPTSWTRFVVEPD